MSPDTDASLVLGIFPRRNAKITVRLFTPLANYLSEKLDRKVRLAVSKDFATFWKDVSRQTYDIVHFNQYHYVVSHKQYGYRVILKNVEFGEATIAGSVVVRKDSGINSVMDLKGKKVVFGGGPKAMQSYIVARYLLEQGGLKHGDYVEDFAKNPPNAVFSAFYKQADAAGSGDKVLRLGVVKKRIAPGKLKYLVRGEQLPHLPWATSEKLSDGLRDRIQALLANLNTTPEGKAVLKAAKLDGLVVAVDDEYDRHREIIHAVYQQRY